MIVLIAEILFFVPIILLAVLSLLMLYVLLRFGKSKILGLILAGFYLLIMGALYATAVSNFNQLPLTQIQAAIQ